MKEVTKDNYIGELGEGRAVLNFFMDGCRPCEELLKTLWEFQGEVDIYRIEAQKALGPARECGVMELPALVLFEGGEYVRKISGSKLGHLSKEKIIEKLAL